MPGMDLLKITDKRPDAEIDTLVAAVIADAATTWPSEKFDGEYPKAGFGIGRLRPHDLITGGTGYTPGTTTGVSYLASSIYWGISVQATSTWQDAWNVLTDEKAYIIVTGIFCLDATPNITQIRPHVDGEDFPVVDIEDMYGWDVAAAYFSKPFAVKPEKTFKMRVVGKAAGMAKFGFIGYVVAKRGYMIGE